MVHTAQRLLDEELITLSTAARQFPAHRGTGKTSLSTVFRWVTAGCCNVAGQRVKLEAIRAGGRWLTSREAVTRFAIALTGEDAPQTLTAPRTNTERSRASDEAARKLDSLGI